MDPDCLPSMSGAFGMLGMFIGCPILLVGCLGTIRRKLYKQRSTKIRAEEVNEDVRDLEASRHSTEPWPLCLGSGWNLRRFNWRCKEFGKVGCAC